MHKVRKNSLSPCYSTANKENFPIDNLISPPGISFRNLEEVRKKKTTHEPKSHLNRTPNGGQDHKKSSFTPIQQDRQRESRR